LPSDPHFWTLGRHPTFQESKLEHLNGKLFELQQSNDWHKALVTSKSVGLPLVAFASALAAIGSIVSVTRPQLGLGLAVLGLIAATAAFVLSFLDGTIAWHNKRIVRRINQVSQATTRYEGGEGTKKGFDSV
jgi:hypothetical protein